MARAARPGRVARIDVFWIFAFCLITQSTAVGQNCVRMCVDSQSPASQIRLMGPLIAQVAVAVQSLPVPVIVEAFSSQFWIGVLSRAAPQIKVDVAGDIVVTESIDRLAAFVTQSASEVAFSNAT